MGPVNTTLASSDMETVHAPRFHSLQDWLSWQEGLHFTAIELGLDRCCSVAERMGLLNPDFTLISVAGTNGKGSSVTMLDMILRRSGFSTGKYTSPHLLRYNERICVDGCETSDAILCRAFDRIDQARGDISLTYFEFGTLAALEVFQQAGVQIAIMEVGLGGRLDAVNILDADAALVTSIDVDHENWLGHDRESVGGEKAGIFRANRPAVCSDPEPPASVTDYASEIGAKLELLNQDYSYEVIADAWNWHSGSSRYHALAKPNVNNDCQIQNAAGVLMLLKTMADRFPVSYDAVTTTMRDFHLNGRFQIVPAEVPYVLDVAHNRQAAQLLVRNLRKLPVTGLTRCVVGMLKDKNHELIFRELSEIVDSWYVVDLESDRAAKAGLLIDKLNKTVNPKEMYEFEDINEALDQVSKDAQTGDRIVITGSFLTVRAGILWLQLEH
jgi:dihydrofolate synthase / folylpolyglutamate synthase